MHRRVLLQLVIAVLFATGVFAKGRPVTDDERTKLAAAVTAEGCTRGKMEFDIDDNQFEVDDARCGDGRRYDLEFDAAFKMTKKKLEN
jgi:hypothetical protein